ncbi:MAG: hypothetical protein R3356_07845 [Eudoraea sp.]|nr:hypothetical protein [Eudoraea sp.]
MKIRIKGNSIRIRLTRSEVSDLCANGVIRETTQFPSGSFTYEVVQSDQLESLTASLADQGIRLSLPGKLLENWADNETLGFKEWLPLTDGSSLHLLVEKDFQCLEVREEDESDQYPNPKALL